MRPRVSTDSRPSLFFPNRSFWISAAIHPVANPSTRPPPRPLPGDKRSMRCRAPLSSQYQYPGQPPQEPPSRLSAGHHEPRLRFPRGRRDLLTPVPQGDDPGVRELSATGAATLRRHRAELHALQESARQPATLMNARQPSPPKNSNGPRVSPRAAAHPNQSNYSDQFAAVSQPVPSPPLSTTQTSRLLAPVV